MVLLLWWIAGSTVVASAWAIWLLMGRVERLEEAAGVFKETLETVVGREKGLLEEVRKALEEPRAPRVIPYGGSPDVGGRSASKSEACGPGCRTERWVAPGEEQQTWCTTHHRWWAPEASRS